MSLLLFNTMSPLATRTHRAVDEEGPEDDDPEEDGAGGLDHLQVAVLVGEQHHHRQAADDHALQHQQDRPDQSEVSTSASKSCIRIASEGS